MTETVEIALFQCYSAHHQSHADKPKTAMRLLLREDNDAWKRNDHSMFVGKILENAFYCSN